VNRVTEYVIMISDEDYENFKISQLQSKLVEYFRSKQRVGGHLKTFGEFFGGTKRGGETIWGGSFNHLPVEDMVRLIKEINWTTEPILLVKQEYPNNIWSILNLSITQGDARIAPTEGTS
jgi:hypothetical protein